MASDPLLTPDGLPDSQERLTRILDSVRLEKVAGEPARTPPPESGCPQCGSTMSWGTKPWCPDCRYSPQLGREVTAAEMSRGLRSGKRNAPLFLSPLAWKQWLGLILGIALILAGSLAFRLACPEQADRTLGGRILFVAGIALLGIAQARAYQVTCRAFHRCPIADAVSASIFNLPLLWSTVLKSLPASRYVLSLGIWGTLLTTLAPTVIGVDLQGLRQDLSRVFQRSPQNPGESFPDRVLVAEGSASDSREERSLAPPKNEETTSPPERQSVRKTLATDFSSPVPSNGAVGPSPLPVHDKQIPPSSEGLERAVLGEFYIFGYLANAEGEMRSVLVATVDKNRGRFVGRVPLDGVDRETATRLRRLLDQYRTSHPALRLSYQARWVKPVVVCQVAFVEWTNTGMLRDGYLVNFSTRQVIPELARKPDASPGDEMQP